MNYKKLTKLIIPIAMFAFLLIPTNEAQAHCDSIDGPVVTAAQKALETGDVNYVLPYVSEEGEAEVTAAFNKALSFQNEDEETRETINYWYYETVVRVHRQGEGAAYTGLKPAGLDYGPALEAAEKAIETGSADEVKELILGTVEDGINDRFNEVTSIEASLEDVEASREKAEGELLFEKYVLQIYTDATAELSHEGEGGATTGHEDHAADAVPTDEHAADEATEESSNVLNYVLVALGSIAATIITIRLLHKKHHKHKKDECNH